MKPINYQNFLGIDTFNDSTRLINTKKGSKNRLLVNLLEAINVDIYTDGHISRRKGRSQVLSGNYKSPWSNDNIFLAVYNGNLIQINDDFSVTGLLNNVGDQEMVYETVYDDRAMRVYFTNNVIIGKVRDGVASLLTATDEEFKQTLPAGTILRFFQGSIYVVRGKTIFVSDVLNREIFDLRYGFKQFESEITMLEDVTDGLFVSDSEQTCFMKRVSSPEGAPGTPFFMLSAVDQSPATKGTACKVFNIFSPITKMFYKEAVIWRTEKGICLGSESGSLEKMTEGTYVMPSGIKGTGLFKKTDNLNQYITVIQQ